MCTCALVWLQCVYLDASDAETQMNLSKSGQEGNVRICQRIVPEIGVGYFARVAC